MRRKLITSLALFIVFVTCFMCSFAEKKDATIRRPLTEFCELYVKRLMEFNDNYGQNMGGLDTAITEPILMDGGKVWTVSCAGGILTVDKSDLTITRLSTTIMDVNAEKEEGHNVVLAALITISALEADDRDASIIELYHMIDKDSPDNIFMKYLDEYSNIIHPALSSNVKKLEEGKRVLVYQGNYDYYACYLEDKKVLRLIARERQ